MRTKEAKKDTVPFSLTEIVKPRFTVNQIRIDDSKFITIVDLPKPTRKLVVEDSGNIGYLQR